MIEQPLVWIPVDSGIEPNSLGFGGLGVEEDEFLVCFVNERGEESVETDRWLGTMWKHRHPTHWAVIPLPSDG